MTWLVTYGSGAQIGIIMTITKPYPAKHLLIHKGPRVAMTLSIPISLRESSEVVLFCAMITTVPAIGWLQK